MSTQTLSHLVSEFYREPDPLASAEQLARTHHDDLGQLTLDEIDAERILARLRWAVIIHHREQPSAWLEERIALLDQRAARLRRGRVCD